MENPYEEQQNAILTRIVANVEKLNDVLDELNEQLEEMNGRNQDIAVVTQMWASYSKSALLMLESTGKLASPLG
ncbi:uncharacterized protein VTP21DRAFT_2877 [Calcarisporiella thermophila]|uniref:uncharacterized protein n=1 Tax=Calcarisporiella thermophila TaxID=911321 RepID=UPI003741FE61